jgi:hypothetical protein
MMMMMMVMMLSLMMMVMMMIIIMRIIMTPVSLTMVASSHGHEVFLQRRSTPGSIRKHSTEVVPT